MRPVSVQSSNNQFSIFDFQYQIGVPPRPIFLKCKFSDAVERVPTEFVESLLFFLKRIGPMNLWWRRRVLSPLTKVARRGLRASTRFMFMGSLHGEFVAHRNHEPRSRRGNEADFVEGMVPPRNLGGYAQVHSAAGPGGAATNLVEARSPLRATSKNPSKGPSVNSRRRFVSAQRTARLHQIQVHGKPAFALKRIGPMNRLRSAALDRLRTADPTPCSDVASPVLRRPEQRCEEFMGSLLLF